MCESGGCSGINVYVRLSSHSNPAARNDGSSIVWLKVQYVETILATAIRINSPMSFRTKLPIVWQENRAVGRAGGLDGHHDRADRLRSERHHHEQCAATLSPALGGGLRNAAGPDHRHVARLLIQDQGIIPVRGDCDVVWVYPHGGH